MKLIKILIFAFVILLSGCGESESIAFGKWGPQKTKAGIPFNIQPDGNSAIWFEQSGIKNKSQIQIFFGPHKLDFIGMAISEGGGSAEVPMDAIREPGSFEIYVISNITNLKYSIGTFIVE